MKNIMIDVFVILLLADLLGLVMVIPLLIVFNRKYSVSLDILIKELPESAFEKFRGQSRKDIDTIKTYVKENLKAQFKQSDYLVNLITSEEFDKFGVKESRERCFTDFKRYKLLFKIALILFVFTLISAIGIVIYYT